MQRGDRKAFQPVFQCVQAQRTIRAGADRYPHAGGTPASVILDHDAGHHDRDHQVAARAELAEGGVEGLAHDVAAAN